VTCCVALIDQGSTWIASDSLVAAQQATWTLPAGKWRELLCGLWVGCSGSFRANDLLERLVEPTYDVRGLVAAIRNAIRFDGWMPDESPGDPPAYDFSMLIARPGEVWELCSNLALIPIQPGKLAAIGSGRQYAQGAASALSHVGYGPRRVERAVEAAIEHDQECGPPVYAEHLL
jgi:ATP-dependent protease HslVU (ClpYQ) peptidase subunit